MDVQGLRDYVRAQLDVDEEELPDALLSVYLQEAFDRTMALDNRWPRNEYTWTVTKLAGEDSVAVPEDLNLPSIMSITSSTVENTGLALINHENAEDLFFATGNVLVGTPTYVSIWNGQLYLWPRYNTDSEYVMTIRGYRQPVWSDVSGAIPDLDTRLHTALAYYAIALAYAQQEDEVLEATYLARWQVQTKAIMKAILEPVHNRPLIMGGPMPRGVASYVIHPPEGP